MVSPLSRSAWNSSAASSRALSKIPIPVTGLGAFLSGVAVTGRAAAVSAPRLSVGGEVNLDGSCEVRGELDLSTSGMSALRIGDGCALLAPGRTALNLTNSEIRSLVRLAGSARVEGTMRLAGAVIHGTLALHGQMSHPENRSLLGGSGLTVDGDVYLDGLRATGGLVGFRNATLGSLTATGAHLHNPGGYSLRLSQAIIKGSVKLVGGFTSTGLAAVYRTIIQGRLQLTGASFTCPAPAPRNEHGHAIEAISATVRGGIDLGWATVEPSVDFTGTVTTFLADDPATWPQQFTISGLTYDRFEKPQGSAGLETWDQAARCAWLARQTTFDSGPYEQAARVFRQHGYASQAEQILIAQRRHARRADQAARWPRRTASALYATVGYGYRPWRVLWILAALLVLVTASLEPPANQATMRATNPSGQLFTTRGQVTPSLAAPTSPAGTTTQHADACGDGTIRCFSPVLYALDTVIPLISLDQRSTWYPDPHSPRGEVMLWWLNLATLLGWLLSSIFVLSLARLARNP